MTAKAFIDTNIYIYALTQSQSSSDEGKRIIALSVFKTLIESQIIVTSTQVLNEFHSNLVKKFKLQDATVFNRVVPPEKNATNQNYLRLSSLRKVYLCY